MSLDVATLTAVVINYRGPALTERCVEALLDDGVPAERIVVVDNGSGDDSVVRLRERFPQCLVVALPENVGYSRSANAGAAALPGEAYLVCNNDAFARGDGVGVLLAALAADDARGIVVPRVLNEDLTLQPTVRPVDTPGVAVVRASGLSRFVPNRWQPRWSTYWDHAESAEIVAADGPVVLVRRRAWEQLGGYNPTIRMYAEDSDLCWRARKLGWIIWFEAGAEFVHLGNATNRYDWTDPGRARVIGSSEAALLREQLGRVRASLSIGFTALGLASRWLVFRLRRNRRAAATLGAALGGYVTGWRHVRMAGANDDERRADTAGREQT
jgi:N-acetylglucosaminyl-diphospho-decaprenol L-rhamnosyltransferase